MYLEIVSPEAILFSSEVVSVSVPGIDGEFQMLNNHAPIVSVLGKGLVKIGVDATANLGEVSSLIVAEDKNKELLILAIESGTIEMKNNKVIVLAD